MTAVLDDDLVGIERLPSGRYRWRVCVAGVRRAGVSATVADAVSARDRARQELGVVPRSVPRRRALRLRRGEYPLGPLVERHGVTQLAEAAGVSRAAVYRALQGGVDEYTADHLAIAVGEHPASVWRTW